MHGVLAGHGVLLAHFFEKGFRRGHGDLEVVFRLISDKLRSVCEALAALAQTALNDLQLLPGDVLKLDVSKSLQQLASHVC